MIKAFCKGHKNKGVACLVFFVYVLLFSNISYAIISPCSNADSYLYYNNNGVVGVDFYSGNIIQCSENMDGNYSAVNIIGFGNMGVDYRDTIQYAMYFLYAFILIFVFMVSLQILNT
jgi:hypothetical protein